ncbi:MAG: PDZ domain-containing protein [Phycisphaerae bacterium]|nr:PDZ domain-containing protein [Phycisphaerae bacterium]
MRPLTFGLAKTQALLGAAVIGLAMPSSLAAVATPSSVVQPTMVNLPRTSRTTPVAHRPRWIGVMVQAIPPVFSRLLGLKPDQGLLVTQVVRGSPAQRAELHAGDLLIRIDGVPLLNEKQLVVAVNQREPAGKNSLLKSPRPQVPLCRLTLIRNGHSKTITVRPQYRPAHVMLLPNGRLVIARHKPKGPGNAAPLAPTPRVAFGPGVVIHFGPVDRRGPAGPQWTHAVMVRQWIDPRGFRHVLMIFQGKNYPLRPQAISSLPVEIQPLARLIVERNRRLKESLTPARIAAYIVSIQQRLKILSDQQAILWRQLQWLKRQRSRTPIRSTTRP